MVEFINPRVTPSARPAGQVQATGAAALQRASVATKQAADTFSAFYEKEAAIENDLILANLQNDWSERYREGAKNAGRGFSEGLMREYDAYTAEVLGRSPDRGRDQLKLSIDKYRINLESKARAREAAARAAAKAAAVSEARRLRANALISDPSLLDTFLEGAPKGDRSLFIRSALSSRGETDPQTVYDQVKGGKWDADLTPSQKLSFMKSSMSSIKQNQREIDAEIKANQRNFVTDVMGEEVAYVEANGALPADSELTDENIDLIAAGDREWGSEVKRRRDLAISNAEMVNAVSFASPAELEAMALDAQAKIQKPGHTQEDAASMNMLVDAVTRRNAAIQDDAAGWLGKTDPAVASQLELFGAVDPEMKSGVADNMTGYMDASYDRIGVPNDMRTYMPKAYARNLVSEMKGTASDIAPQMLATMVAEWGDKSSAVINQLRKEGLPPEFVVAMRHVDNPGLSAEITNLRGIKEADLTENLPSVEVKEINDAVIDGTEGFAAAYMASGGPEAIAIMNQQVDVMRRLAYQRALTSSDGGSSIVDALSTEMFPETVLNENNIIALAPKELDANSVINALNEGLTDEALGAIVELDIPGTPKDVSREVAIASLQSLGTWVNNATGDGFTLMYDVGGRRIPVEKKGGGYYEIMFNEITSMTYRERVKDAASKVRTLNLD